MRGATFTAGTPEGVQLRVGAPLRIVALAFAIAQVTLGAQSQPSARAQAPRDISGYWVAVVSEDWHWRMVTPRKGDFTSLPLNPEGRRVANAWDPSKEKAGDACKPFGAAAIMRVPGRVRSEEHTSELQ